MAYKALIEVPCFVESALYAKLSKRFECDVQPVNGLNIAFPTKKLRFQKTTGALRRLAVTRQGF